MKKLVFAVCLALLSASLAYPANVGLKDGRVLRDAVVIKQDAITVTFRHAEGFTQVEKSKLPQSLLAEYPLDEAQAKRETEKQAQEALARAEEAKRIYALRLEKAAATPAPAPAPALPEAKQSVADSDMIPAGTVWESSYYPRHHYNHAADRTPWAMNKWEFEHWRTSHELAEQQRRDREARRTSSNHYSSRGEHSDRRNSRAPVAAPAVTPPAPKTELTSEIRFGPSVQFGPSVRMVGFDSP